VSEVVIAVHGDPDEAGTRTGQTVNFPGLSNEEAEAILAAAQAKRDEQVAKNKETPDE